MVSGYKPTSYFAGVGLKAAGRRWTAVGRRWMAAGRPQDAAIYSKPSHSRLLIGSTLAFEWCHFDDLELYLKVISPSQVQYLRNYIGYDHRN